MKRSALETRPIVAALGVVLVFGFAAHPAEGWDYRNCRGNNVTWPADGYLMEGNTTSFPNGSAWTTSLLSAVSAWNLRAPSTDWDFTFVFTNRDLDSGDSWNVVAIDNGYDFDGAAMVTIVRSTWCLWPFWNKRITEADIVVDPVIPGFTWDNATNPDSFDSFSSSTIAFVHEMGHGFGLQHDNGQLATMNDRLPTGGSIGNDFDADPHADDVAGDRGGYGTVGSSNDLIASAFRRLGPAVDTELILPPGRSQRGGSASYLFTVGNRGVSTRTTRVDFYLSTNQRITTADTFLGSTTLSIPAGVTTTRTATVNIPAGQPLGRYHFGYIVDAGGTTAETDEGNNAAGHAFTTRVEDLQAPTACATISPRFGVAPMTVTLSGACSTDPDGNIVSFRWDLGDGSGARFGQTITHTYFNPGSYSITLTVTDNDGLTSVDPEFVVAN